MPQIVSINIHDPHNLGDQVCNPCDYFDWLKDAERVDAWKKVWPDDAHLIFGGGGLLHGDLIQAIRQCPWSNRRKLIWWGGGHNVHGINRIEYGNCLDGFNLIGSRDFYPDLPFRKSTGEEFDYVPCPSCLHPLFDRVRKHEENGVVIYEHRGVSIPLQGDLRLTNDKRKEEFESVITLLAGASLLITNTYHGSYWAMLLGKKFAIYKPFSSRFAGFKYWTCEIREDMTVDAISKCAKSFTSDFLQECREANLKFANKVMDLICQ